MNYCVNEWVFGNLFIINQPHILPPTSFPAPYVPLRMNPTVPGDTEGHAHKDAIFFSMHKFLGGVQTPGELLRVTNLFCRKLTNSCATLSLGQKEGETNVEGLCVVWGVLKGDNHDIFKIKFDNYFFLYFPLLSFRSCVLWIFLISCFAPWPVFLTIEK